VCLYLVVSLRIFVKKKKNRGMKEKKKRKQIKWKPWFNNMGICTDCYKHPEFTFMTRCPQKVENVAMTIQVPSRYKEIVCLIMHAAVLKPNGEGRKW
jgi:hypothetical protein